jgi:hypothetical protein
LQAFGVVAGENELHRAEKPRIEFRLLVGKVLPDAVTDRHAAILEFQYADRDAVHIQDYIGAPFVVTLERNFLGNREIVFVRREPVGQVNGFSGLARFGFDLDSVAEQFVNGLIIVVQIAAVIVRLGTQLVQRAADLCRAISRFCPGRRKASRPRYCCCRCDRSNRRDSYNRVLLETRSLRDSASSVQACR